MKLYVFGAVATVAATLGILSACDGCTKQEGAQAEAGIEQTFGCVVGQILSGNVTPLGILGVCGPQATATFIVDVVDDVEGMQVTEAGVQASVSDPKIKALFDQAKTNAMAAKAASK